MVFKGQANAGAMLDTRKIARARLAPLDTSAKIQLKDLSASSARAIQITPRRAVTIYSNAAAQGVPINVPAETGGAAKGARHRLQDPVLHLPSRWGYSALK